MNLTSTRYAALRLYAAAATASGLDGTPPAVPNPMLDKLQSLKGHVTGSVPLEISEDNDEVCLTFNKAQFMSAVGPSKGGLSNGSMITLNGRFEFDFNGTRHVVQAQFPRGAWVSVRVVDAFPVPSAQ